jgi:YVTN family beta-propeller protein
MAATRDAVWVADADRGLLVRVDPEEVRTVDTVPIGEGTAAVAAGAGAVWVVAGNTRTVSRVNVDTNDVVKRIPVGNGARAVAVGAGSVWVANGLDGTVSRIDPASGRETHRIRVGSLPSGIAVGAGAVWVANESDGTVTRINPFRSSPVSTIRVGSGPAGLTVGAGGVWVANADDGTVSRIDPRTDAVTGTVAAGVRPVAVAVVDGDVWVAGTDGLRRIDPDKVQVTSTRRLGASHSALVAVAGRLWTAAQGTPDSHKGGTLRMAALADSTSLDPARAELGDRTSALLAVVADGLVGHRRAGGAAGAAVVPDLARALPERADGGLTYRFQLRPGLRYSTGRPVRARDARASIERLHLMDADAVGVFPLGLRGEERCSPAGCDLSAGISTDDAAGTVTFHLRRPNPDFLLNLAVPMYALLPSGSPASDLTGPDLVGTGPYRIASRSTSEVALERNPRFRVWSQEAQPDGFPDRIVWTLGSADADVLMDPSSQQLDRLAVVAPTRVHTQPRSFLVYAWFNTTVAPFNRLEARQAVAAAVDRRKFRPAGDHTVAGLSDQTTCQLLSPGFPGYDPSCTVTEPDLDRARRLVKRSGTAGTRVRFWVVKDDSFWLRFGRQLVRTLRSIGYRASLEARFEPPKHVGFTLDPTNRAQAGGTAWIADKPSASNVIEPLLMCPRGSPGTMNQAQFCDPVLDARMRRAHNLEATEPAAANDIWPVLDRELVRRAPIIPILTGETAQVTSERVGNYQYHLRYGPLLAQAWVK